MDKKPFLPNLIKEMRVKSWIKNLFVFFPVVFSLELFQTEVFIKACLLTLSFCLVSSAVYILNDINDVDKDRKHEVKKNRPIAAGIISMPAAWVTCIICVALGLGLSIYVSLTAFIYVASYVVINIFYSKWLKTVAVIDCFCIAAGFVLRVLAGGTIVSGGVSNWMFLTIVALSLFMAFGKRRGELQSYGTGDTRVVLEDYEINFLNGAVFMCAALAMVFYSLWSINQKSELVYTVPIVLFIMSRYLLLVFKGHSDADPTTLILSDKILLIVCFLCGLVMIGLLYGTSLF
ncbi:MAG: UbiA prenyltransferase family protein [Lachnospiraceae bacterium]|nr:UbiA prenyltransferase family protein [Lachnospiraceae bacterium]